VIFVIGRVWLICKCGTDRIERRGYGNFIQFSVDRGFLASVNYDDG